MKKHSSSPGLWRTGERQCDQENHETSHGGSFSFGSSSGGRCGFWLLQQATTDLLDVVPAYLERLPFIQVRLGEAVVRNQAVWSAITLAVADPNNRLSDGIKSLLRNLYLYVDANSRKLLAGDEDGDLEMLIMINQNVLNGLNMLADDGA